MRELGRHERVGAPLLDQFLPLRRVGAVVFLRQRRERHAEPAGSRPQLAITKCLERGIRAAGVERAGVLARLELHDHPGLEELRPVLLLTVGIHARVGRVHVGRTALDEPGHRRRDLGGHALGFLVVLQVGKARQHRCEDRHAAHLVDAVAQRQMPDAVGRDPLAVGHAELVRVARVLLEQVIRLRAVPLAALDAVHDPALDVVVVPVKQIGLDQLDRVGHDGPVVERRDQAHDVLRQDLAVTKPGSAEHPLRRRPVMVPGDLGRFGPVVPEILDLPGQVLVQFAGCGHRLRLDADARGTDNVLFERVQRPACDVVVALKPAGLGTQRRASQGDGLVPAAVVRAKTSQARLADRLVCRVGCGHECARPCPARAPARREVADQPVEPVHWLQPVKSAER